MVRIALERQSFFSSLRLHFLPTLPLPVYPFLCVGGFVCVHATYQPSFFKVVKERCIHYLSYALVILFFGRVSGLLNRSNHALGNHNFLC